MRQTLAVLTLLLVAGSSRAADAVYLDQLVETPLATLQGEFTGLKSEGCYAVAPDRYLLVSIDKKDQKPWRVILTAAPPCRRPDTGPTMDVRERAGVQLGDPVAEVVRRIGQPNAASRPEDNLKKLGDMEYFYICRVSEGCARHTSIFLKEGVVAAISEWYSE
jgi:hypothetical protein